MKYKIAVLNSGGMDSALMIAKLLSEGYTKEEIVSVFVKIGQIYMYKENLAAKRTAGYFGVHHIEMHGAKIATFEHESGIIPFRNAELILCGAQHGNAIALGALYGEINSDKSPEFLLAMQQVLNISHRKQYWTEGEEFKIITPLGDTTKAEAIRVAHMQGLPMHVLYNTVSCYNNEQVRQCGHCSSCFKRWVALANATGKLQSEEYAVPPWQYMTLEEVKSRAGYWDPVRLQETLYAYSLL